MLDAINLSGDTPIFSSLNYIKKSESESESEETKILGTMRFLGENGANLNVVNSHGYSPLLLAGLRKFDKVKDYLSKHLTRSAKTKQASNVDDAKSDEKIEKKVAETVTDLFFGEIFGGRSCAYLKGSSWFEDHVYRMKGTHSFEVLLKKVENWLKMNDNICDIESVKQVAFDNLEKIKSIEEDVCVICYSNRPSVTFFPCGHKIFCDECHELGSGEYEKKGCAYCRQKICMFVKLDVSESKKTSEKSTQTRKKTKNTENKKKSR